MAVLTSQCSILGRYLQMDGSLFDRGKAMEERFFSEKDKQLLDQLKAELSAEEDRKALATVSGISDAAVLDALVSHQVTAESLASVSLIPLVAVAWADGVMEEKERDAILQAAEQTGIENNSASHKLLQSWMSDAPSEELLTSWKNYIGALKENLEPAAFGQLKNSVMGRARSVAEAAGGILGFGKTSDKESDVIEQLEAAFG